MKRSSDPTTSLGKPSKKRKVISSADIQQVLDSVVASTAPAVSPPSHPPSSSSPVATRLRPRPPRANPPPPLKTKASRKSKQPTKLSIQPSPSPPPPPTTKTPAPVPPVIPPKVTAPSLSPLAFAILYPKIKPSLSHPPKATPPLSNPPPPKSTATTTLALPPIAKVPPKTKPAQPTPGPPPPPPLLTPSSPVTLEAAKILVEISPTQFTPSLLQSSTFQASLLPPTTPEYALISTYISNSQAHSDFHTSMLTVLNVKLGCSPSNPPSLGAGATKNPPKRFCMMLWHGTKPFTIAPTTGSNTASVAPPPETRCFARVSISPIAYQKALNTAPKINIARPQILDKSATYFYARLHWEGATTPRIQIQLTNPLRKLPRRMEV